MLIKSRNLTTNPTNGTNLIGRMSNIIMGARRYAAPGFPWFRYRFIRFANAYAPLQSLAHKRRFSPLPWVRNRHVGKRALDVGVMGYQTTRIYPGRQS
jgi:7-cyano-7-deazaguanine synthase in queuosine biosynthesis